MATVTDNYRAKDEIWFAQPTSVGANSGDFFMSSVLALAHVRAFASLSEKNRHSIRPLFSAPANRDR